MPDQDLPPLGEETLLAVAMAIADGSPIDWSRATPSESASPAAEDASLAARLQHVERLVRGHDALRQRLPIDDRSPTPDETLLTAARRRAGLAPGDLVRVEWGPLVVLEKIGRGSFGHVYRAWDPRLEREVALKLLHDAESADPPSLTVQEGRLLARIRHPNVVTVYGAERVGDRVGIWMEYVRGRTLAEEVREHGPMSAVDTARIGVEVCRALVAVHAAGLLHRDVKAHNVMRDVTGRIVLGDFGTGVEFDDTATVAEPQIAGTPLYLAPEVFERQPASAASDVYSVGVLLYFLVTGDHPVRGRTVGEIRRAHAAGERVPLRDMRSDLPDGFVDVVEALLDPGPDRRHGSAASAEAALATWLAAATGVAQAERGIPAAQMRARRLRLVAIGSAVAGVGSLVLWLAPLAVTPRRNGQSLAAGSMPVARQLVNAPCSGPPSANGTWIACVEWISHLRARGAEPPPPIILFNQETGEARTLWQPPNRTQGLTAVISPDARRVAVTVRAEGEPVRLHLLDVTVAAQSTVAELGAPVSDLSLVGWSAADGHLEGRLMRRDGSRAFVLVSPDTGAIERTFDVPVESAEIARSPDGRLLALTAPQEPNAPQRDIRACDLFSGACATVSAHPGHDFSPIWSAADRLMFTSERGGTYALWAVSLDGLRETSAPELVRDTGRSRIVPLGFSRDGTLFYNLWTSNPDIYTADVDQRTGQVSTPVRISPRAVDVNRSPVWSADGRRLAYVSQRGPFAEQGSTRVVVRSVADGTEREFRYDLRFNMSRLAWSPDGKMLALRGLFGFPPTGSFGIHLIDASDGRIVKTLSRRGPRERFVEDQIRDIAWRDSRTILFSSQAGIHLFEVLTGEERVVWRSGTPVAGSSLSPDGESIAVITSAPDQAWYSLAVLPSSGGTPRELLRVQRPEWLGSSTWSAGGEALLVTRHLSASRDQLWRVPLDGGMATPFPLVLDGLDELRMHLDGRRLVFTAGQSHFEFWTMTGLNR